MSDQQQEARWHQVGDYICDCADGRHGLQDQAWVGANRVNADEKRIAELADANEALRAENAELRQQVEKSHQANHAMWETIEGSATAYAELELRAEALAKALEACRGQQGAGGALRFVVEVKGLGASPQSPKQIAEYLCLLFTGYMLYEPGGADVTVSLCEEPFAALDAHRAEAPKTVDAR